MMNASEALNIILDSVQPLGLITISLPRALGHALGETIVAQEDVPPFDNAAMDGYAVRSEDLGRPPAVLKIIGEVSAGSVVDGSLKSGEAVAIMTGGRIPSGSDAVVQVEWTEELRKFEVKVLRPVAQGQNIRKRGNDIQKDAVVLEKGHVLRPQEIGVLASLGREFVEVYRPVRVAILTTGNEIVDIDKPLIDGKIRNSNSYSLRALVQDLGGEPIDGGIARDEREEIREKVLRGFDADVLITSGGVSVGKHDHVREVLKEIGTDMKFWKVNIKPGMPMTYGLYRGKPVFGLPGNPVSTVVTFLQFVKPALLKMMGHRKASSSVKLHATLGHDIKKTDGKRHFIRGILEDNNGKLIVRDTGSEVSNVLSSLTKANCLVIIPENKELIHKGDEVEVELL